ncbi:MAG: class I SAM-dependent methyltransferase [Chloroflexia bacterium]|nr:class I SAM-dependent methyltransferase [Chloroflexia bacterium]MDQ3413260.1 class I SAM-dependent methyltransferase [Chloroflexota bacterium]
MATPRWYPDELAHAGDEHLDPGYVQGYDRKAGTDPTDEVALLRTLGLDETSTVVDLGAGTGAFALAVAPRCRRVIAVDVSAAMLALLQLQAGAQGLANIEWVQRGFLTYEHRGEPADFVYSRHALHHLPEFWKGIALGRIAAILKPGGVFRLLDLVYAFDPGEAGPIIESWLDGAAATPALGWTRPELETHLREEYSTFTWLLEPMLERAGLVIQDASRDPSGIYAAYTCVKTSSDLG